MIRDDELRVRLGRVRDGGRGSARLAKPFIVQALIAAEKAGGIHPRFARRSRDSSFGRGRAASLAASRQISDRSRRVIIKARVVRQKARGRPLRAHFIYLRREGATRHGAAGRMFDAKHDEADHRAFAKRCEGDRHHFRFIVSPEDGEQLSDLRAFARDLMAQAQRDLGTTLDWIGADHWNTDNPHIHVIVRGKGDDGRDLVIARDYISHGMRARAARLATLELGPRSDVEIRQGLEAEVEADRWTNLDRALAREADRNGGVVDLRRDPDADTDGLARAAMVGRMQKLERLALARALGPAQWHLSESAEPVMRTLGERGDIIKRMHRRLAEQRITRSVAGFVLDGADAADSIIGRLVARGLDDELKGTAYVVIDGVDGRAHHIRLTDLDAATDAAPGSIVEARRFEDASIRLRMALTVLSDLPIDAQVHAKGATWLDRQLVATEPAALSTGAFGGEVRDAMDLRVQHLVEQGFARREGQRFILMRDLLDTLRRQDLEAAAARIAGSAGLRYQTAADGLPISGMYRRRLDLASGRFAMIADGLGFTLVPWSPSLEQHLGRYVSGIVKPLGVEWRFGRARGPTI